MNICRDQISQLEKQVAHTVLLLDPWFDRIRVSLAPGTFILHSFLNST